MAVTVNISTESGDDYLIIMGGKPTHKEVIKKIKEELGDEFEYICSYNYKATFVPKTNFKLKTL